MFFTRSIKSRKKNEGNLRDSNKRHVNEIHMLVPIQDYEQGRLAIRILRQNKNDRVKSIRIFQCVKDRVINGGFVHALEVIHESDAQEEQLENSFLKLQSLADDLAKDLPAVRISFNSRVHTSIDEAIVEESERVGASLILFVQHPKNKRHWLIPGVSNRVLRCAPCAVQIIKPGEHEVEQTVIVA